MAHEKYKHIGRIETRVIEEVGELLQAMGKVDRFGILNSHPDRPDSSNLTELLDEIEDLCAVLSEYKTTLIDTHLPFIIEKDY